MFNIDLKSDKPIYEQIIDNIKELVLRNILKEDDKLPSVRQMASILSVNPNTVSKSYQELERQKVIVTVRGRGTFINKKEENFIDIDRVNKALEDLKKVSIELFYLGFSKDKILGEIEKIYEDLNKEA